MRNEKLEKQMGLYEIENINNANVCTIAVNPKSYFEKLKNRSVNKKHKGVRRDTPGMNFESYAEGIKVLREIENERRKEIRKKKLVQKWLQVKNTQMRMTSVKKVQFFSFSDKRYYFSDGIVSLPCGYPLLSDLQELKKFYPKIHTVIKKEKDNLLRLENQAVAKHKRLRVLWSIFTQSITFYKLNGNTKVNQKDSFDLTTTRDYILNSKRL